MKSRIENKKPLNLNDQLNAINKGLIPAPMFPTPVAADADTGDIIGADDNFIITKTGTPRKINRNGINGSVGLARLVKLWPTPRAGNPGSRPNKKGGKILAEEVKLFPTPKARDGRDGENVNLYRYKAQDSQLPIVVMKNTNGGVLNPNWVEALMGYPQNWTDINKSEIVVADYPAAWLDGSWEENIPRVTTNKKNRINRLKGLGNAVVPQIPALIFLLIIDYLSKESK